MPERLPGGSRNRLHRFLFLLILVSGTLGIRVAAAQTTAPRPAAADTVAAVDVVGNTSVDTDLVRRGFGVAVGSRYSLDAIRRGLRHLYDLGFFSDIVVEGAPAPGGVTLTLRVTENPKVASVEFAGAKKIKEKDFLEALGVIKGKMADDRLLARVERTARRLYLEKGYTRASIRPRYLPADSPSRRILLLEVVEGPKVRVEKVRFLGAEQIDPKRLKKAMKQGTTGFLSGGVYHPEVLEADMDRIEEELAKHGFRDGEVLGFEVVPGSKDDRVVAEITIREGPLYYTGTVNWTGNEAISTGALEGIGQIDPGSVFNQEKIRNTVEEAHNLYMEYGYLYLNVQPDFAARDSVVDVTFRVTEGEPSKVHDIIVSGNTRTKEKVIRRQLAIRPGDLFRRSALVRSQRELLQLGYFSDLQVGTNPVPGSSDIDLVLSVEEKQVGTASAGFGFSSSVGLTGFMELGHTNLFGNGQQVNLRMERGRSRNNADLSITEPWFLGTPTSLGLDLFTTNSILRGQDLDLDILRQGGAIRVGRPLPIPYTRLYASYRLENQRVVDESNDTSTSSGANIKNYLTGFRLDQENSLSSALSFTLTRNSTDHPIYPTVGSNGRFRVELSGGPMGGDQVFQKYEFDLSRYMKAADLGGWKPVFMVRSRLGAVAQGFRDDPLIPEGVQEQSELQGAVWDTIRVGENGRVVVPVPWHRKEFPPESSELFRMGGTTFNALRGYDDFEIVPTENVQRRYFVTETSDTLGVKTYDVNSSTVYYPGGRYMMAFSAEWQFPIADPLHGLFFGDLGGTWNEPSDFRWDSLHKSLGFGVRMEVPLIGLIGFDYGYGFDRLDRATGRYDRGGWEPHIQLGRIF